ncbi:MAG: anaerobic ribonucleoside-triphosphate reductase, partial [Candidatus Altiarchaeales archaeon]
MAHRYVNRNIGIRVIRSDNSVDKFNPEEIIVSCMNAGVSSSIATSIALDIAKNVYDGITTREIREMVYSSLRRINPELAERYKYRARLRVRTSRTTLETFDRKHIVNSLVKETGIDRKLAEKIARDVGRELERMRLNYVTAPLIREIVNVKLLERGLERERAKYTRLGMPVYDVKDLIEKPHKENANLQYNPETVHKLMADQISKEYALINVLPIELADSHMRGEIHIHDLDYFATRPFCFSHDIRFFLKNGFKADGVGNHTAIAGPAKRPEVAFLHAAKVLAASQTNCSGGQGFSYF